MSKIASKDVFRTGVSLVLFIVIWEVGGRSKEWLAADWASPLRGSLEWLGFRATELPWIGAAPAPSVVAGHVAEVFAQPAYWESWYQSFARVLSGFVFACIVGVPFGLLLATSRTAYGVCFPVFEVLRPIPPLAWVPASIIFWPTQELSIAFVTFLGAFYTIVINVVSGARAVDHRYLQLAASMGASRWNVFRRIILPATLPSIVVGAVVGMGITWEVVVAAEMISGGGSASGESGGGGLGFLIWNAYVGGSYEVIVIGMVSIGIAGLLSSELLRWLGTFVTPWLKSR